MSAGCKPQVQLFADAGNEWAHNELWHQISSCQSWMKTIQQDLKSSDLNMDNAVDLAQNRPFWRLMSMFGATHALLVVLARNDDDDESAATFEIVKCFWPRV